MMMSLSMVVMLVALLVVIILAVFLAVVASQRSSGKAKRREMLDPLLDDMAARGRLELADDGELPEWVDDALTEKPKRSADD